MASITIHIHGNINMALPADVFASIDTLVADVKALKDTATVERANASVQVELAVAAKQAEFDALLDTFKAAIDAADQIVVS